MTTIEPRPSLGDCLKVVRQRQGWTLTQVSQMTGLATSTLSKVENNQMSLTYDKLLQLAHGLKIDIAELFGTRKAPAPPEVAGRRTISRDGDGRLIETATYDYLYVCQDISRKDMVPMIGTCRTHSIDAFGALVRHPGQEYAYVLEGELDLYTDLYEPVRLKAGDSVYFDAVMGHAYISRSEKPARFLCVCSTSEQTLIEASLGVRAEAVPEAEGVG